MWSGNRQRWQARDGSRRGVSTHVGVSIAAILVAGLALSGCGRDEVVAEEAPGFSDRQAEVDRSAFRLAGPSDGGGPTTLPEAPELSVPGRQTTTTTIAPAPPTSWTTTTLPERVAPPGSDNRVCRSFYLVANGVRNGQNLFALHERNPDSVPFEQVRDGLVTALELAIVELGESPNRTADDVPSVLNRRLVSTASFVAGTDSWDQGGALLYPLVGAPPEGGEPLGWPEIERYLLTHCPTLIFDLTGSQTLR